MLRRNQCVVKDVKDKQTHPKSAESRQQRIGCFERHSDRKDGWQKPPKLRVAPKTFPFPDLKKVKDENYRVIFSVILSGIINH